MNAGHKHHTRWSFGDAIWHKVTKDKGMVMEIVLKPNCAPNYMVVFEDDWQETECMEFELTDEPQISGVAKE